MDGRDDVQIKVKMSGMDLYSFNMKNAYSGMQGILSIVCAALVVFVLVWKFEKLNTMYVILFIVLALAFLLYIPISLWFRSMQVVKTNEIFKEPLTYTFDEENITVTSPVMTEDEHVVLPYSDVFRVTKTRKHILIYTNRISAYIIPRAQVGDTEQDVLNVLKEHVDSFKLKGF